MYVYLKDDKKRHWISDVELVEGHSPCVGSTTNRKLYLSSLEPARWFKVLILDSVCVDCSSRKICWTTSPAGNSPGENNVYTTEYSEGECYDYDDDIDELFVLANKLINRNGTIQKTEDEIKTEDYQHCLLRMLHCYILPKVTLHSEDMQRVKEALEKQNQNIKLINEKAWSVSQRIEKQKNVFLESQVEVAHKIGELVHSDKCSRDFLEFVIKDFNKSLPKIRVELNECQETVQEAKKALHINNGEHNERKVSEARSTRDIVNEKLNSLLIAREMVSNALDCMWEIIHENNEVVDRKDVLVRRYLDDRKQLHLFKEELQEVLKQKVCASSVREILVATLNELEETGFTQSTSVSSDGLCPTDVLQLEEWHPEWQTLSERLISILSSNEHPLGIAFNEFCDSIQMRCQTIVDSTSKNETLSNSKISCVTGFFGMNKPNKEYFEEAYGIADGMLFKYRSIITALKDDILQHFNKMTLHLREHFSGLSNSFHRKLRLSYERFFFEKMGSFIECVYEVAHKEHIRSMEVDVKRIKRLPISWLDLQMKDEWWLKLFNQTEPGTVDEITPDMATPDEHCTSIQRSRRPSLHRAKSSDSMKSMCITVIKQRSELVRDSVWNTTPSEDTMGTSVPSRSRGFSMNDVLDSFQRSLSEPDLRGDSSLSGDESFQDENNDDEEDNDSFQGHFGSALGDIQSIFKGASPLAKLQHLTSALRKVTSAVTDLRSRDDTDEFSIAVSAEDLLPLIVLMLLQLEPWEAASILSQLKFIDDFKAPFLSSGCHGFALAVFQMAEHILSKLCTEF